MLSGLIEDVRFVVNGIIQLLSTMVRLLAIAQWNGPLMNPMQKDDLF